MKAEKLQVFIDSVTNFFKQINTADSQVDPPYINTRDLCTNQRPTLDTNLKLN